MSFPPPPVGFQGLIPHKPITVYTRNLPHWRQEGATYFVTFHALDALPRSAINDLIQLREDWKAANPDPHNTDQLQEMNRRLAKRTEFWLEKGYGECLFAQHQWRNLLHEALLHFQEERVDVGAFVLMPNHGHCIVRPLTGHTLEDWLGSVRGFVTHQINQQSNRQGRLWQPEPHDRIVRDLDHLNRCLRYIGGNPAKAGLPMSADMLWINSDWQRLGWTLGV